MADRPTHTAAEIRDIARNANLGEVHFEERVALNTGKTFRAAYVNDRELFAKATRASDGGYYLCNDFARLESV